MSWDQTKMKKTGYDKDQEVKVESVGDEVDKDG